MWGFILHLLLNRAGSKGGHFTKSTNYLWVWILWLWQNTTVRWNIPKWYPEMLQREFRHIYCPFSPVSKTAVKKSPVFSSTFLFSLEEGKKWVLFLQNPLHRWTQTEIAKWHIAACQGLMQHFTSSFAQLLETPKPVPFIPDWWIHPCILALCISEVMKSQQPGCQEQGACTPNTVTVCCRNNFQGLGASLQASASLPRQSQLKLLQQPLQSSSYTQLSPRKAELPARSAACSSLVGSWWVLLIHVNGANLIHSSQLDSHLEYARSFTPRCLTPDLVSSIGEVKSCTTNKWFGLMFFAQMRVLCV